MIRLLKSGLILSALILCLSACAPKIVDRPVVVSPPVVYMQHVAVPEFKGRTNADILNWALSLQLALQQANSDKAAIRAWLSDQEGRLLID